VSESGLQNKRSGNRQLGSSPLRTSPVRASLSTMRHRTLRCFDVCSVRILERHDSDSDEGSGDEDHERYVD
jgi:hypothetical protein